MFGAPTGAYMGLTCFQNGSLARERVREDHALTWSEFSHALASTPAGNGGRIVLPWFSPEITPPVSAAGVHRYGRAACGASDVRAVVEGQMLSMALHSRWMVSRVETIHATGGGAINREILQVMADVFGARVFQMPVGNSAALGAALRAAHAHMLAQNGSTGWADVIAGLAEPLAHSRVDPDPDQHSLYRDMVVKTIHQRSRGESRIASGRAASNVDSSQINCTFYDALGRQDVEYLIARAIQCFVPGIPQIYYVGLLAGRNDLELLRRTRVGRDINRHHYEADELRQELTRPVVQSLLALLRIRNMHPAFQGTFDALESAADRVVLVWTNGEAFARLDVNLTQVCASMTCSSGGAQSQGAVAWDAVAEARA